MKKIQGLWRGRGSGNIVLFTSKPKKTPNMKTKYGHKQTGYEKRQNSKRCPPKRLQYLTRKHPITQKHPTIHEDNWKRLKITVDGDEQKTQVPEKSRVWRREENIGKLGKKWRKQKLHWILMVRGVSISFFSVFFPPFLHCLAFASYVSSEDRISFFFLE